jgi:excisionase family DNA binding protein
LAPFVKLGVAITETPQYVPYLNGVVAVKTPLLERKYIIRYGKEKTKMNARNYYSIFKHEPDILTVPDVVRLLRMGKNTVYKLIKEGSINSIKQGKKIIIPKVCLVEFLLDQKNYQILSPVVPNNHWTCDGCCGSVGVAQESKVKNNKKGA